MRIRTALLCSLLFVPAAAQGRPPGDISPKAVIAPKSEPGERLVLTATVYGREGKAPLPNVTLFAYHTDATGVYSKRLTTPAIRA